MTTNNRLVELGLWWSLCLTMFLCLTGCPSLNAQRMVPAETGAFTFKTNQSIRKVNVSGGQKSVFGGPDFVTSEHIHEAVTTALTNTGLFDSVDQGNGDLDLFVIVRSQDHDVSAMLEIRGKITITYRFIKSSADVVWAKTYESAFSSHTFAGAVRSVRAREGAVRENMKTLVKGLRESWPRS